MVLNTGVVFIFVWSQILKSFVNLNMSTRYLLYGELGLYSVDFYVTVLNMSYTCHNGECWDCY
jgi:hypothetical protein